MSGRLSVCRWLSALPRRGRKGRRERGTGKEGEARVRSFVRSFVGGSIYKQKEEAEAAFEVEVG